MKTYKELLNEVVNHSELRKLTEEESNALKACTLEMFDNLYDLCKRNNLALLMGGGSALGTVRHKGFIPWDDDMDLMMARPDYDKLLSLLEHGEMGDKYEFRYPNKYVDTPNMFLKIYQKDTLFIGIEGKYVKYPNGLSIDVFPIDGVPSNIIVRHIKGFVSNCLRLIANMVFDAELELTPVFQQLCAQDKSLNRMIKIRRFLGRVFLIILSHKIWAYFFDKFAKDADVSNYVSVPTGRKLYMGEVQSAEVFFPPTIGLFEGREVLMPAKAEEYLKGLYGDYMWIPPEDKRESHFVLDLYIPERYYNRLS